MTLHEFAQQYRLRKRKCDECGDLNIFGRRGDIYDYGDGKFFCATILHAPNALHWNKYREAAVAIGLRITQNGDTEGTFLFDPAAERQAVFAIRTIRAFRKRKVSSEALARLAAFNRKTQSEGPDEVLPVRPDES